MGAAAAGAGSPERLLAMNPASSVSKAMGERWENTISMMPMRTTSVLRCRRRRRCSRCCHPQSHTCALRWL